MRSRVRIASILLLGVILTTQSLAAQATYGLESPDFRAALNGPYLDYLRTTSCPTSGWHLSMPTTSLRTYVEARIGPTLGAPAGKIISTEPVVAKDGYRVELVMIEGRHPDSPVVGYLVRPDTDSLPPRVALILHGGGMLPPQALGWLSIPGSKYEPANHTPLLGSAVGLAQSGWTVFVPWISEKYAFWPLHPWEDLTFAGAFLNRKTGSFSAWPILFPEVQSGLDALLILVPNATSRAVIGWGEGAHLAGVLGAMDPRITAIVRFDPPLDRQQFRATRAGIASSAPFTQWDCTIGDVELAALTYPRPILHVWARDDQRYAAWAPAISDSVARIVQRLGGGHEVFQRGWGEDSLSSQAGLHALRWLNRTARAPDLPAEWRSAELVPPPGARYPSAMVEYVRNRRLQWVTVQGSCRPITYAPDLTDPVRFRAGQDTLRRLVLTASNIRRLPTTRQPRILTRQVIAVRPAYRLEWIYAQSEYANIDIAGLLATPTTAGPDRGTPAVLSFDGNYSTVEPFGLPPTGRTPYLNAYADALASEGRVVFAPTLPRWFPSTAEPILQARLAQTTGIWSYLLGMNASSLDLLLAQPTVDTNDVTAYGISYAGQAALYLTAFDRRVTRLVYSNPVQDPDSVFKTLNGALLPTWYSSECASTAPTLRYLVAPRRFIWENGALDEGNGFETSPLATIRSIERVYQALGVADRFTFVRHGGGHETHPEVTIPLLRER